MRVVIPAVILFGGLTWLLMRSRSIRALEAVVVGLFGFFLASTGLGVAVGAFLASLLNLNGTAPVPGPGQVPTPTRAPTSVTSTGQGVPL